MSAKLKPLIIESFEKDIQAVGGIDAVPTILDVVCRTTGMGFAAVARVTQTHWIACRVRDDINFGLKAGGELDLKTTICDEIRDNLKPVIIDHVEKDAVFCNHHTPAKYGFQSYISFPIVLKNGEFFGTLCAIDPKPRSLKNEETIGMFKLFAELISFHLNALDRMNTSEAKLSEEREDAQLREQFIAVLGHDLRNPLGAIASGAALLHRSPLDERGKQITNMIRECTVRMTGLIENVLDFARGRMGGGITLERKLEVSLEPMIAHSIEEMHSLYPDRALQTSFDFAEAVYCDKRRIAQLLSNLLGNAMTYGSKDQPVHVRAFAKHGTFELSVANAGKPISAQAMEKLFKPFVRGEKPSDAQGLGLGLYIAWQIAEAHSGALTVTSNLEETRFTLRFPSTK